MANFFDTTATKIEFYAPNNLSNQNIYDKFKVTIDFNGSGWSNTNDTNLHDVFDHIHIVFYNSQEWNSATLQNVNTKPVARYVIPVSEFTKSGDGKNWYDTYEFDSAYKLSSYTPEYKDGIVSGTKYYHTITNTDDNPEPFSANHFQVQLGSNWQWGDLFGIQLPLTETTEPLNGFYPFERPISGKTVYYSILAVKGGVETGTFTNDSGNSVHKRVDGSFDLPQIPKLVFETSLVNPSSGNDYYRTSLQLKENSDEPKYRFRVDVDGAKSKSQNGTNWNSNNLVNESFDAEWFSYLYAAPTQVAATDNYVRYKISFGEESYQSPGTLNGLQYLYRDRYYDNVAYVTPPRNYSANWREKDENDNDLKFSARPIDWDGDLGETYYIIQLVIVDVKEWVFNKENNGGEYGEIVVTTYFAAMDGQTHGHHDAGDSTPSAVEGGNSLALYIPQLAEFDASSVTHNLSKYLYTAPHGGNNIETLTPDNPEVKEIELSTSIKLLDLSAAIPEYAVVSSDVLSSPVNSIKATIQFQHEANIPPVEITKSSGITTNTALSFGTFQLGDVAGNMWQSMSPKFKFEAFDSAGESIGYYQVNRAINNSHKFRYNFEYDPDLGQKSYTVNKVQNQANLDISISEVQFLPNLSEYLDAPERYKVVNFKYELLNSNNVSQAEGSMLGIYWTHGTFLDLGDQSAYPTDFSIPISISMYSDNANTAGAVDSGLKIKLSAYDNLELSGNPIDTDFQNIMVYKYEKWSWRGTNPILANPTQNGTDWNSVGVSIFTDDPNALAQYFIVRAYANGSASAFVTKTVYMSDLSLNTDGTNHYYNLGTIVSSNDMNSKFDSIYDNANYTLKFTVSSYDNLGTFMNSMSIDLNLNDFAVDGSDLTASSAVYVLTDSSAPTVRDSKYLKLRYYQSPSTGRSHYLGATINSGGDSNSYITATGISSNIFASERTLFKEALTPEVYNGLSGDDTRILLADIPGVNLFTDESITAVLSNWSDVGTLIDSQTETVPYAKYEKYVFNLSTIEYDSGMKNSLSNYFIKAYSKDNAGAKVFDYMKLEVRRKDNTGRSVTYQSLKNGNTFWNLGEFAWTKYYHSDSEKDLSITSSLIDNRFTDNVLQFRIIAVAAGTSINWSSWQDFTVPKITYNFNDLNMSIYNDINNFDNVYLKVDWTPGSKETNYAKTFKLKVWDNTFQTYDASSAESKKEFILYGHEFTASAAEQRYVDNNQNFLDIISIIPNEVHNRWSSNQIHYQLEALKSDGTVHASSEVQMFEIPAVSWNMDTTNTKLLAWQSDTINSTIGKFRVYRSSTGDAIPKIKISIQASENIDGTTPSSSWFSEFFDTTVLNTPGDTMYEDFLFTFPSGLDRNKASKYKYQILGGTENNGTFSSLGSNLIKYTQFTPWLKINSASISFTKNTINDKEISLNIRSLISSTLTRNPQFLKLKVTRTNSDNTTSNIQSTIYSGMYYDTNDSIIIDIRELYSDATTDATSLKCEVIPENYESLKKTTSTINISGEPQIKITESNAGLNVIIADNGDEYLPIRFKPDIDLVNFIPAEESYTVSFAIGEGAAESITLSGDTLGSYHHYSLPTGRNVINDQIDDAYYNDIRIITSYQMNRDNNEGSFVTNNVNLTGNKRRSPFNKFPKSNELNSLSHGFDENGNGKFSVHYLNEGTYNGNHNQWWTFEASVKETVKNSIDVDAVGTTTGDVDVTSSFKTLAMPIASKISSEANYLSDIVFTIKEKYSNESAYWNDSLFALFKSGDKNESAPVFSETFINTKVFNISDVVMNDFANYPASQLSAIEVMLEDIEGEYELSGKRIKFKLGDDNLPFTNIENYYGFGLSAYYNNTNSNKVDSSSVYLKSDGSLYYSSNPSSDPEVESIKNIYTREQLSFDGEWYYIDTELDLTKMNFPISAPWNDDLLEFQYKFLTYSETLATTYESPNQANKISSIDFRNQSNWASALSTSKDLLKQKISNINSSVVAFNSSIAKGSQIGQIELISSYRLTDANSVPYSGSLPSTGVKIVMNQDDTTIGSEIYYGNPFEEAVIGLKNVLGDQNSLNTKNYDPTRDVTLSAIPITNTSTNIGGVNFYSKDVEFPDNVADITTNYKDLIVPSFEELYVDNSLNEDSVVGNAEHNNRFCWLYNKTKLKNRTKVFSYSEEYVRIIRNIRQGEKVYNGLEVGQTHHWYGNFFGSAFSRSTFNDDFYKLSYNDTGINIAPYSNQGLDPTLPYVFEYEIIPSFRYKAADDDTYHELDITDKKVFSYIIPDEFPIGNNGVVNMSYNYNDKHSIEILWDHRYDEDILTLHSVDAKIYFDLYYYYNESYERKNHSNLKTKPVLKKLNRILNKQTTPDTWSFIDRVEFKYPDSPEIDSLYPYSYLWRYEKLESESDISIIVNVIIESDFVGEAISQRVSDRGILNTIEISNVKTDDKNKKNKLITESDKKFESLRHVLRNEEFILKNNLEQIPFSVTRKKAKPRGNKKPYISST